MQKEERDRILLEKEQTEKQQTEKQSKKKTQRIKELDSFKGFLIFIVVLGHFLLPLKDSPYPLFSRSFYLIYSFHMPAFVFLSGYFGYSGWKKRGTNFRSLLSYVFLYLFMQGMLHICDILFYGSTRIFPDFWHASSTPWYILALIFWNLALLPAELFLRRREGTEITAYLLFLLLLSVSLSFLEVGRTLKDFLALDRSLSFAPFYYLGFLAKCYGFSFQKIYKLPATLGLLFSFSLFGFLPQLLPYTRVFYGTWGYRIEREAILPFFKTYPIVLRIAYIPFALCIAYFFFFLLRFLLEKGGGQRFSGAAPSGHRKKMKKIEDFLQKTGEYTLPIFVFHRPFRDAFFACGADRYFLEGGLPLWTVTLFYLFLICFSLILLRLLGRKALDAFCRFRLPEKRI